MDPVARLVERSGGFCPRSVAVAATSRRRVERAVAAGLVRQPAPGRLCLPTIDDAVAAALSVDGVLVLLSAALWHGWEVKTPPLLPQVAVPRGRRGTSPRVSLSRPRLHHDDVTEGICTSVEATLDMCLRRLPADEALCVADSALRHGTDPAILRRLARDARGPGSAQLRRVAGLADDRAANPFESVLRHLALGVPGLHVQPQRVVVGSRQTVRPDLVDEELRIVLEADSFRWHGGRSDLARDARRYNLLVVDGWLVLRFSWEDVMHDPDHVVDVLTEVTRMRTNAGVCASCAA